jgi:hypothetical protein
VSENEENGNTAVEADAGNEFGRGAHKKKKVTISAAARIESTRATQRHVMMVRTVFCHIMDTSQSHDAEGLSELDTQQIRAWLGVTLLSLTLPGKLCRWHHFARLSLMQCRMFQLPLLPQQAN